MDSTGAAGGTSVSPLPEPEVPHGPSKPPLTPEQAEKKAEVDQLLAEQFQNYTIVQATQGASGDITYWVDSATMPGAFVQPPPPTWAAEDLVPSAGAELGLSEIEQYPGPPGTTPIHRPDFENYIMGLTGATSIQDYLENYQEPGAPADNRLYAGLVSQVYSQAVSGTINQFEGDVEEGTFSLIEIAAFCGHPEGPNGLEMIGVVVSRDRSDNFDRSQSAKPTVHIEYVSIGGGYPTQYLWDERANSFFVQYPGRRFSPGKEVPGSTPGGIQIEQHFDLRQDGGGNWWIARNGEWLGYYPAGKLRMLSTGACLVAWYGEVFDPTPDVWTWTPMGSSMFASAQWPNAAYVRDPAYRDLLGLTWSPADYSPDLTKYGMMPYEPLCYSRSVLSPGPPGKRVIYMGGPGGVALGCKHP